MFVQNLAFKLFKDYLMIYAKLLPFLLLKHTVPGGVATAVGNYGYRKSAKQMLHRRHMVITNLVTSANKKTN